jgi:WD40 repeat protein
LETGRVLCTLAGHARFRLWRGSDAGREARGFRVRGQDAEGVGFGDRPRTVHTGRPLWRCQWRGSDAGRQAAVSASDDKMVKVWDLETDGELRTLEGHSGAVNGVAVTPDGKRAVSASFDHTLKVWDLDTGRELRTLEGHSGAVNGVAVTPDGKRAVSASWDWDYTLKVVGPRGRPRAAHPGRPL